MVPCRGNPSRLPLVPCRGNPSGLPGDNPGCLRYPNEVTRDATTIFDGPALTQMVRRPGFSEFEWGQPDPSLLPVEGIKRATTAALEEFGATALVYGAAGGPWRAGDPYLVGEHGAELVVPSSAGSVMNTRDLLSALAGGSERVIHNVLYLDGKVVYEAVTGERDRRNRRGWRG